MGKTVVINQPYYFPQLHWWKRISNADIIVLLNDVTHNTNFPINRSVLFDGRNKKHLTIPIKRNQRHGYINEIEINNSIDWIYSHEQIVNNYYKKYKYFYELDFYFNHINRLRKGDRNMLINVVNDSIIEIIKKLNLAPNIINSNELNINEKKNDRLISICKKFRADNLILGLGSKNYVDSEIEKYIDKH